MGRGLSSGTIRLVWGKHRENLRCDSEKKNCLFVIFHHLNALCSPCGLSVSSRQMESSGGSHVKVHSLELTQRQLLATFSHFQHHPRNYPGLRNAWLYRKKLSPRTSIAAYLNVVMHREVEWVTTTARCPANLIFLRAK